MRFVEVLDEIRAEADVRSRRQVPSAQHEAQVAEAVLLLANVMHGRLPISRLQEALTTSDFPLLFGDILDRQVLAAYREWPSVWTAIARRAVVSDFRNVKVFPPAWGADSRLDEVREQAEYPEAKINEQAAIQYAVKKYGRRIGFSWEAITNDDLQQLTDIPQRFGRAARRTESRAVIDLYVDASGPHASLYTSGNKNIINATNAGGAFTAVNPPLSIAGLQQAYAVLANMKDENGEPMFLDAVTLVVPPALEVTAQNILNATSIEATTLGAGGAPPNPATAGEQRLVIQNWMRNRLTLVVDPYIPMVASSANGNTSWFLFANPNTGREALRIAFLRGHEEPEIWIKSPNAQRVGGGMVDPMDGDFDTDTVQYRVRHVVGATRIDPKGTVASNGSGA
jgi:hypothetical protein